MTTKKLQVHHDHFPENEIFINATCLCDFCQRNLPEWKMVRSVGDMSVCDDCHDHYTASWD
jgi:hypothetical protein